MIDNKDNEIILCKGIKLDRNYENVLSYNESDMVTLCRNNAIYQADEYNFIEKANNRIVVSHPYSSAMYANYVAFKNPRFGNKWIFAWVTDVKLINIGSTEITFEVDVWSTWYSRFNLSQVFVEREHVDDDTIGKHTIPEGLETGEYVVNAVNEKTELNALNVIMASNVDPSLDSGGSLVGGDVGGGIYNDIRTGFKYYHFANDETSSLPDVLKAFSKAGKSDAIISLFIAPFSTFEKDDPTIFDNGVVKQTTVAKTLDWLNGATGDDYPVKLSRLDSYRPVNNKLLTFPYCYLRMTNNNGNDAIYHFEKFVNANNDNYCRFSLKCAITPGMSIICYPRNYDGITNNFNQCLQAGKFPICGWANDSYTNWLTQNGVNIATQLSGSVISMLTGGIAISTGNTAGLSGLAGGLNGIANTMSTIYQHSLTPMEAKGNLNTGDVKTSSDINTFTAYSMSIKREFAISIDRYFSRFGYKVNEVKTPNLNSRAQFNFIKVGGMDELVHGDIPSTDLEKINEICRKGVTIFHNYSNIGNYTISNPIVN